MNAKYVINRLVFVVVVIWTAATANFFLPRISGQNPIRQRILKLTQAGVAFGAVTDELIKSFEHKFGLDKPPSEQYLIYLGNLVRLDLGISIANYPTRVDKIIGAALPWTIGLLGFTTIFSVVIGSLLGAIVAWHRSVAWLQVLAMPLMAIAAIPYYLLGLILLFIFAWYLKWVPGNGGYGMLVTPNWSIAFAFDVLHHLILPAFSIILSSVGFWALGMRSIMVNVEGEDFMILAEAKGLKPSTLFFRYGVRNALLPQATSLALALGYVLSGSILVEVIYGLPGLGGILFEAIKGVDFPVIQGISFSIILAITFSTLILDLILPLLDPRINYGRA